MAPPLETAGVTRDLGRGGVVWTSLATVAALVVVAPWLYLWWDDELSRRQPSLALALLYLLRPSCRSSWRLRQQR